MYNQNVVRRFTAVLVVIFMIAMMLPWTVVAADGKTYTKLDVEGHGLVVYKNFSNADATVVDHDTGNALVGNVAKTYLRGRVGSAMPDKETIVTIPYTIKDGDDEYKTHAYFYVADDDEINSPINVDPSIAVYGMMLEVTLTGGYKFSNTVEANGALIVSQTTNSISLFVLFEVEEAEKISAIPYVISGSNGLAHLNLPAAPANRKYVYTVSVSAYPEYAGMPVGACKTPDSDVYEYVNGIDVTGGYAHFAVYLIDANASLTEQNDAYGFATGVIHAKDVTFYFDPLKFSYETTEYLRIEDGLYGQAIDNSEKGLSFLYASTYAVFNSTTGALSGEFSELQDGDDCYVEIVFNTKTYGSKGAFSNMEKSDFHLNNSGTVYDCVYLKVSDMGAGQKQAHLVFKVKYKATLYKVTFSGDANKFNFDVDADGYAAGSIVSIGDQTVNNPWMIHSLECDEFDPESGVLSWYVGYIDIQGMPECDVTINVVATESNYAVLKGFDSSVIVSKFYVSADGRELPAYSELGINGWEDEEGNLYHSGDYLYIDPKEDSTANVVILTAHQFDACTVDHSSLPWTISGAYHVRSCPNCDFSEWHDIEVNLVHIDNSHHKPVCIHCGMEYDVVECSPHKDNGFTDNGDDHIHHKECVCGNTIDVHEEHVYVYELADPSDINSAYVAVCQFCGHTVPAESECKHENRQLNGEVPADCTHSGRSGTLVCLDCGTVLVEDTEVPALGHLSVHADELPATCVNAGHNAYDYCGRCGVELTDKIEYPATGVHTFGDWVPQIDPSTGSTVGYTHSCTICGYIEARGLFIVGDVNGDETVNALDRIALTRYLAGWDGYDETTLDLRAADVNEDGTVNALDRIVLTRHLAQWEGYEALPYHKDDN